MQVGKTSGLLRTNTGYAVIALTEIKPPYAPQLAEVKDKVKEDVVRVKAVDVARAKAAAMAAAAKTGAFAAAAKSAGVDVKTTDFVNRGFAYPETGVSGAIDTAVFALPKGGTSDAIPTDNAVVVAHVVDKQDMNPLTFAGERDSLRDQLLQQRRQEFFASYMAQAKKKMKIDFNMDAIKTLVGG